MYFDVDALEHPSLGGWRRYMSLLLFPVADFWLFIVPTVHAHTKMFITGKKDRQTVRHKLEAYFPHNGQDSSPVAAVSTTTALGAPFEPILLTRTSHLNFARAE